MICFKGFYFVASFSSDYPKLFAEATEFLLTDLDDPSEYLSVQYFTDNAINPCIDSTYAFMEHIIIETVNMHKDIQVHCNGQQFWNHINGTIYSET